jgi:hypothetical protein
MIIPSSSNVSSRPQTGKTSPRHAPTKIGGAKYDAHLMPPGTEKKARR